jgi:hypothetical protein
MPPSERNAPPADEPDDIVEKTPSHPVTTTLLIVSSIALIMAIGLTLSELGHYVNKGTREQLQQYKLSAVDYYKSLPESGEAGEGAGNEGVQGKELPGHRRAHAAPAPAEAPAEAPASEPEKAPAPAGDGAAPAPAGDAAPAPEGGN